MSYARSIMIAALLILVGLASPAATHAASPPTFRVESAQLFADPERHAGPCPALIQFKGMIRATGPGTVKYTFLRSDGATDSIHRLDFAAAGEQIVVTNWTLGDARMLPRYEGWQAIKILSPNELKSEPAKFVVECKGAEKQIEYGGPTPVIIPGGNPAGVGTAAMLPQPDGRAAYQSILPELAAPRRQQLERELSDLKAFAEGLHAKLKGAPKAAGFDDVQLEKEFRELLLLHEPDADKRAQRAKEFRLRYADQFMRQAEAAGINMGAERQRMGQMIGIWPADVSPEVLNDPYNMAVVRFTPEAVFVDDRPPAETSPPAPSSASNEFRGPYTSAGTEGGERQAVANTNGFLWIDRAIPFAGSAQTLAYVTQDLPVESGYRTVKVTAVVNNLEHVTTATSLLAGYASAEAIINLRVLEGTRVVASERVSVRRAVAAVFGFDDRRESIREAVLKCEFVRAAPASPGRYTVVVEFEGWAGAGGMAGARVAMNGTVRPVRVQMQR